MTPGSADVARPRLIEALQAKRIGVVEAGSGYGKSSLAAQYAAAFAGPVVSVPLTARDAAPPAFVRTVLAGLRRAGLSDAAARVQEVRDAPDDALDALLEVLAAEADALLLAIDDAHVAGPDVAAMLARVAQDLPERHRLLLLARVLPAALEPLRRRRDVVHLGATELAFTFAETSRLLDLGGVGAADRHATAAALHRATGGWATALVVASHRLDGDGLPLDSDHHGTTRSLLAHLVLESLSVLDPADRDALVQLAHLPLVSPALAAAVVDRADVLTRAASVGLPWSTGRDGWWSSAEPVREALARLAPLEPTTARRAGRAYLEHGEAAAGVRILLDTGLAADAAAMLAGLTPAEVDAADFAEFRGLVEALPRAVLDAQPRVLLHLARACEPGGETRLRAESLERAAALLAEGSDAVTARGVDAELARDIVLGEERERGEELAQRILDACGTDELDTRARAFDSLGRASAWRKTARDLDAAVPLLDHSVDLCRRIGQRTWLGQVLLLLAFSVHYERGDHERAVRAFDEALQGVVGRARTRAVILTFRAQVLVDVGRYDEAMVDLREAGAAGARLDDARITSYVAWECARMASQQGHLSETLDQLEVVERSRGDWFRHGTGVLFLTDAADFLSRLGEQPLARAYLDRARERHEEAEQSLQLAEGAYHARGGDPLEAERLLADLSGHPWLMPRDRWRVTLLRAFAALRRDDPDAARLAAAAFDASALLGTRGLPFVRERAIAERLVSLAADAGSLSARAWLSGTGSPLQVSVLGTFSVARAGRPIELPPGRPELLVKLLAVAPGGRVRADVVIEQLWPGVEPASGRKRLRNTLNRLREASTELVSRDGDDLVLGAAVDVDARRFEAEAEASLTSVRTGEIDGFARARAALARYSGDVLQGEDAAWAATLRQRLRRRQLALLDVLISDATNRGELDDALRLLERSIEAAPGEDDRYVRAARLLVRQGRRVRALEMLDRGRRTLASLGLRPGPGHESFERELRR